jgi:hypothetical protein
MTDQDRSDAAKAQALIPGAYEPRPVSLRKPGGMSGPAFGSLDPRNGASTMDEATTAERRKEGGGER